MLRWLTQQSASAQLYAYSRTYAYSKIYAAAGAGGAVAPAQGMVPTSPARRRKGHRIPRASQQRDAKAASLPEALVVGVSKTSHEVTKLVRELQISAAHVHSPHDAATFLNGQIEAVVVVPPFADHSVVDFSRKLCAVSGSPSVFIVSQGSIQHEDAERLYDSGVNAVFEWPLDRQALKRTLYRALSPRWNGDRRGRVRDAALEELVREHLKVDPTSFGDRLHFRVQGRFICFEGEVDALWKLHVAEQIAQHVAGVEDVFTDEVRVRPSGADDDAVRQAVQHILHYAMGVDEEALTISIHNGHVTLSGTISDRHELARALAIIRHVRGVTGITSRVTASCAEKVRDHELASRLKVSIATHYPDLRMRLAVYGGVVVLQGDVPDGRTRKVLEHWLRNNLGWSEWSTRSAWSTTSSRLDGSAETGALQI